MASSSRHPTLDLTPPPNRPVRHPTLAAMAPSWVLLDREVPFPHDPIVIKRGQELVGLTYPPSDEEMIEAITFYLRTLKPVAVLDVPPVLSSILMLPPKNFIPPLCRGVISARISSSDKNLVALYAGDYCPGSVSEGCYLIYNARSNSLSTIPQLPFDHSYYPIGPDSAVVVSDGEGDGYLLAELIRVRSSAATKVDLYLWRSSATKWVAKAGHLPLEICQPSYGFRADMCFLAEGSTLCYVDLFKGLVVCDLNPVLKYNSDPEFCFIPLPHQCPAYDIYSSSGVRAEEFRSMAYVQGAFRFVTIDGYPEHGPGDALELAVWTLSPDWIKWEKTSWYNVSDIWANEFHQANGMPNIAPSLPVLSMDEDDVVYLVFTDVRVKCCKPEYRGQYLLRVDMSSNEVQFSSGGAKWIHSPFMASDFSAYQQGSVGHQGDVEASESGASAKRMKL